MTQHGLQKQLELFATAKKGYGVRAARDPWGAAAPYVCFAEKVCDNGLTTWVRLVAYGK